MGFSKEKLKLRCAQCQAQRIGDLGIFQFALLGMPKVDEFCTCDPHHEGAEVFGSQKRKLDTPIGVDEETYRLDTIQFSKPRLAKRIIRTRATTLPTIMEELDTSIKQMQPLPLVGTDIHCVTAVQKSMVNEKIWHIASIPKTSAKACWAQMAVTKKKCIARIVLNEKSTPAPTYAELWCNVRLNCEEQMQFFFCFDKIERCIKGSRRKWVIPYSNTVER